jgi:hypothetical protein
MKPFQVPNLKSRAALPASINSLSSGETPDIEDWMVRQE